ncbi:TetR family transcriptional regulator [Kitasatospora sp. NPDC002551]|uniref:TetR family transcriptional regulator n=1 Tax=Kitasatospora sp. NPDC002551 TaxID=3154539 RepID=UPI00332F9855
MSIEKDEAAAGGRRGRKARRTRESLAGAALRLVLDRGLAAVAVEDVTELADVSRRTFSRYFPSREDAVLDCLRADFDRINAALAARPADETPLTAYRAALRAWLRDGAEPAWHRRPDMRELFALIAREPSLTAAYRRICVDAEEASIRIAAERLGLDAERDLRPAVAIGLGVAALQAAARAWVRRPAPGAPDGGGADGGADDLPELLEQAFAALTAEPPPTPTPDPDPDPDPAAA